MNPCSRLGACVALLVTAGAACTCEPTGGLGTADRSDGQLPKVTAPQVDGSALRIDGRLDEAAWERAGETGPFVRPSDGLPAPASEVNASARVAWSDTALYVAITVHDDDPSSRFERDEVDPHVWEGASGVELMLQPGDTGDNRDYYEVQVGVNGEVWDTRFDDYNQPVRETADTKRYGHQDWSSRLERAVRIDREEGSYTVEMALPWDALERARTDVPPEPDDGWRMNLYAFRDGQRQATAWSPILGEGNFHRASRFGRLIFGP